MLKTLALILLISINNTCFASTFEIPQNKRIDHWVEEFSKNRRQFYQLSIMRSGLYRKTIVEKFKKAGLPVDLSWLPFVESGFNCSAKSTAKAAGCWQFISRTGNHFGLRRNNWEDQRFDFKKSTVAAARYLKELHSTFKDWELALAAYNCGPTKVRSEMKRVGKDYWKMNLPEETMNYIPQFYAVIKISRDLEKYGFSKANNSLIVVKLKEGSHSLRYISETVLGVKYKSFKKINPGYEIGYTQPGESASIYLMKDWDVEMLDGFGLLAKKNPLKIN